MRREFDIDDRAEKLFKIFDNLSSKLGWNKLFALFADIFARRKHHDGRSVSRRSAYAFFFHRFDEAGFGVACWRFCKFLLRLDFFSIQKLALNQRRKL